MTDLAAPHYQCRVSDVPSDPEWDAFVANTPGGHHVQTSMWGRVKAGRGWTPIRVVARRSDGAIVGGAQLLVRPLPAKRAIAYVPKGPVTISQDPGLIDLIIAQIAQLARSQRVEHLTIQPANTGPDMTQALTKIGFVPTDAEVAPTASVQIDLTPDEATILARMKKNHRRYIRYGLRQGLRGRRGSREDLETFHRLLTATAHRQGFTPYPLSYFVSEWDILSAGDHIALFLVEYEGEPVSAQLVIGFGDTVFTKNSGWSGEHSRLGPNHVLEWTTMQWAKAAGYRIYDLEGIDAEAARVMAHGGHLTDEMRKKPFFWKLGFGGQVTLFPPAYVTVPNRLLRVLFLSMYPKVVNWKLTNRLLMRFRTG
jgi:lipid II:glycine glycyltransferase (peptidoglycan interpeptide bridge formation enzyme)